MVTSEERSPVEDEHGERGHRGEKTNLASLAHPVTLGSMPAPLLLCRWLSLLIVHQERQYELHLQNTTDTGCTLWTQSHLVMLRLTGPSEPQLLQYKLDPLVVIGTYLWAERVYRLADYTLLSRYIPLW